MWKALSFSLVAAWDPELGPHSIKITGDAEAQRLFSLGLGLLYGFDHYEALAYFTKCAEQFPKTAMCHWGKAYAYGPFINEAERDPETLQNAYAASQTALSLLDENHSETERILIEAEAVRFPSTLNGNQTETYSAYVDRLENWMGCHDFDPDVWTFYADAQMIFMANDGPHPGYHFYHTDGSPTERTTKVVETLTKVLGTAKSSHHQFAEHLMIHITEPSSTPERALTAALNLEADMVETDAGHLQHMPSHTYLRVGKYHNAVRTNTKSHGSDVKFLTGGLLPYGTIHDAWFLVYSAWNSLEMAAALPIIRNISDFVHANPTAHDSPMPEVVVYGEAQHYLRNGNFDKIEDWIAANNIDVYDGPGAEKFKDATVNWNQARVTGNFATGLARLQLGDLSGAADAYENIQKLCPDSATMDQNQRVANLTLSGLLSVARGDSTTGITALQAGSDFQESWRYEEPPLWFTHTRECLGQVLLDLKKFEEARDAFEQNLSRSYDGSQTPWSLFGLRAALKALPDTPAAEIEKVEARLETAMQNADYNMTLASPMCAGLAAKNVGVNPRTVSA